MPMIGVNDIASEVFKLSDTQALLNYAQSDPKVAEISNVVGRPRQR